MLKEITLSVKRSKFRRDDPVAEHSNKAFSSVRKNVLKRDNHTCQFCGFRSQKWQEVHHIDDNHSNNDPSNLITICPLCHLAHHIGLAGLQERGILIYLPEMSQAELNTVVRTLWIGERGDDPEITKQCKETLAKLYEKSKIAEDKMTKDPNMLGELLLSLSDQEYEKRAERMDGFLLLPLAEGFSGQLDYWIKETYNAVPSSTWKGMSAKLAETIESDD